MRFETQVEEVGDQERGEQAGSHPKRERRPELTSEEDKEVGSFDCEGGVMQSLDFGHARDVLERNQSGREAVEFNSQSQGMDDSDAAKEGSERVRAVRQS